MVTGVPLKVTVLDPWLSPKFDPLIVISAPTAPCVGDKLLMLGAESIVKFTPLLAVPETVTTTFPVVVPVGTGAVMLVAVHAVGVAVVPPNATVLEPCVEPKPLPVMVTEVPTIPDVGEIVEMAGPG